MHVAAEYLACVDCYLYVGRGVDAADDPETTAHVQKAIAALPDGGRHLNCGDEEKDHTFSWRPCEVCGCKLGGSRHHMIRLAEGSEPT